jgi:hypothetical protein
MQRLLGLLIALALLIVPMGMLGGTAAAHSGTTHADMEASSCHEGQPAPEKTSKHVGMSPECAVACAALPAMPARIDAPAPPTSFLHSVPVRQGLTNAGPESLDPPPRV